MASSSTTSPAGSTPPLITGEQSKNPAVGSTASAEAVEDVPVAPPSIPGEAINLRKGFVFPLVDPWDTKPLREVLRRWCPATHTFFFAWGELTLTLEDIANHCAADLLWEHFVNYIFAAKDKAAAWDKFSNLPQRFLDCFPDFRDNLPLVYCWVGLKTWDHDLVASLNFEENVLLRPYIEDHSSFTCVSALSLEFTPYCAQKVKKQFGLDQDVPPSLQESAPSSPSLAPFIKSRAFAYWEGKVNHVMIPSGHRFGFNTTSMNAYWQRLAHAMVGYVNSDRSNNAPISNHCNPQISSSCFSPPSQSAIAYGNSQKLCFVEWDEIRRKGNKRDVPVDPAVEKGSKKLAHSPKKASSKKTNAGKKSRSAAPMLSHEKESATTPSKTAIEPAVAPSKAKGVATGSSKRKSAIVPPLESVGKQAASSKAGKKSVALRPPKDQRKPATSSSSSDEEQPSTVLTHSPPKKKKSVVPPSSAATRTRSKNASVIKRTGSKATHKFGGPSGAIVVIEDSDTITNDTSSSFSNKDDPLTVATDQGEDMGRIFEGNFEADVGSTEGSHSIASDSFSDIALGSMNEEQMVFVGSAANGDDVLKATELNVESANLTRHNLAIVTHSSHSFEYGRDDDDVVDSDAMPLTPMAYVVEGVSLFGATPRFGSIPAGGIIPASGIIIPTSRITGEAPSIDDFPVASEISMPKEVHTQGFVRNEFVVDLGVASEVCNNVNNAIGHGMQDEGTSSPAATTTAGGEHLDNIGEFEFHTPYFGSRMQYSLDIAVPYQMFHGLDRIVPIAGMGSSVEADAISGEVADFFREFDKRTPNPYPEWHFWKFNGPLVSFRDFWVPSDRVPYLQQLIAKHGNFVAKFKLGDGFGGPMLSLLNSVLAAMSKFDLGSMTKIALLQDSLAVLTTYQEEMMSMGVTIPELERSRSLFDSLIN
uniref:Aminotransferase-like plant mobile domain-containing protein n=1 Tax=Fagus sylvatica TaxID=28930 RepID=A0A2N9FHF1_FAGSY